METSMKGESSLARLCFSDGSTGPVPGSTSSTSPSLRPSLVTTPQTQTNNNSSSNNGSPSTSPSSTTKQQLLPQQQQTSTSPQTAGTSSTNKLNNNNLLSVGLFPGPNCKCIIATHIAPMLDERSLVSLMRTCKRLREVTTSDEVWEKRLKEMRVNVILVNRTSNFFRAFRCDVITLRGLEGFYDFESEDTNASAFNTVSNEFSTAPVTAIKKVMMTVSPAFLGFVTPVARVCLVVQYFGMHQEDVFEGTVRYSFPKRLFVMSTYLTRAPRQEGPKFDIVVARSVRKWGTQKPSHFDSVKGGTRLILSISQSAQSPANGYLPQSELLTVSRIPREGEGPAPPLPDSAVSGAAGSITGGVGGGSHNNGVKNDSNLSGGSTSSLRELTDAKETSSSNNSTSGSNSGTSSKNSSPPTSEKRFSLRSLLGGMNMK